MASVVTVAELDRWALARHWGQTRRARMEEYLQNFVVHPFDRALCLKWAEVSDGARAMGGALNALMLGSLRPQCYTTSRLSPIMPVITPESTISQSSRSRDHESVAVIEL